MVSAGINKVVSLGSLVSDSDTMLESIFSLVQCFCTSVFLNREEWSCWRIGVPALGRHGYMHELALRLHTRHAREMMSLGNEAVENERAQGLTVPVAAGAVVVVVVLCSAIYSVLHYLF